MRDQINDEPYIKYFTEITNKIKLLAAACSRTSVLRAGAMGQVAFSQILRCAESTPIGHGKAAHSLRARDRIVGVERAMRHKQSWFLLAIVGTVQGRSWTDTNLSVALFDQKGKVENIFHRLCEGLGVEKELAAVNVGMLTRAGVLFLFHKRAFGKFLFDDTHRLFHGGQLVGVAMVVLDGLGLDFFGIINYGLFAGLADCLLF